MKVTLDDNPVTNAINYGGEKELVAVRSVVVLDESKAAPHLHELITVRWYRGHRQAITTWCSVWVYPPNGQHRSGSGRAAGQSLASSLEAALESAGVVLVTPITWQGHVAVSDTLTAVAEALGYSAARLTIVEH